MNKKKKAIIIGGVSFVLVGTIAATSIFEFGKKDNKDKAVENSATTVTTVPNDDDKTLMDYQISVDDIGLQYENPTLETSKPQYGEVTGDIKKEEIVEKEETIWKDQEAADKSEEVGKVEIDDKKETLEVKPSGDVVSKEEGYEVKDQEGNVTDKGSNETGIPDGYAWDSVLNKYVEEEQVGKYIYVDTTYYAPDGAEVFKQGEIVLKETFEKMKNELTTVKPDVIIPEEKPEETVPETKPEKDETTNQVVDSLGGIVNEDGTYTIYGATYMDKATFEAFVLDENAGLNFGYYNDVIYPKSVIEEMFNENQKTK